MPDQPSANDNNYPKSEIRKHYYLDRYVIIAPIRSRRADMLKSGPDNAPHKVPNANCPFCHNTETALYAYPDAKNWQVKVMTNRNPQLSFDNPKAFGTTEIVLNTPDHDIEFSELSIDDILLVFDAYNARLDALKTIKGVRHVFVFKNDGPLSGASIAHAHCQIYALPLVPPRLIAESDAFNHYQAEHNSCAVCDVVAWEDEKQVRVVYSDEHLQAIAPYASAHFYEVWFIPRRHVGLFGDLNKTELRSLAKSLKKVTGKLDRAGLSFNYHIQEAIDGQDHHLMVKLEPRRHKEYAGAEMGMGIVTNPVAPEAAAEWYNEE